jgi:hypothetical protein
MESNFMFKNLLIVIGAFLVALGLMLSLLTSISQASPTLSTFNTELEFGNSSNSFFGMIDRQHSQVQGWTASLSTKDNFLQAADSSRVEFVGQIGGSSYAVTVSGTLAYVGMGSRMVILDVSEPATPTIVGQTPPLPGTVKGIAVAPGGDIVYIAADRGGLRVIDVRDPANPSEIGSIDDTLIYNIAVASDGATIYVAGFYENLQVIDVSDPTNPTQVASLDTHIGYDLVLASGEDLLYTVGYNGFQIIDVSTPTNPTQLGPFLHAGHKGVAVAPGGETVYVADGYGLGVIDVRDPISPTVIGYLETPGSANDVVVASVGDIVYVADEEGGLRVIDVSTPDHPFEIGALDILENNAYNATITTQGNIVYFAAASNGLQIINVSTPTNPTEASRINTLGLVQDVAVAPAGNIAYVANTEGTLRVLDTSTISQLHEIGSTDILGNYVRDVVVSPSGDIVYLTAGSDGLQIIDVSNPTHPTEIGRLTTLGEAYNMALTPDGDMIYLAAGSSGLQVIDVSTLTSPTRIGEIDTPGNAYDVVIAPSGDIVYVADEAGGLRIIDVSAPDNPTEIGVADTYGDIIAAPGGNHVYLTNRPFNFSGGSYQIIDVSTPVSPTKVGTLSTYGVTAAPDGNYLYGFDCHHDLEGYNADLWILDVRNPISPTKVGELNSLGHVEKMVVSTGNHVYVPAGDTGLVVLHHIRLLTGVSVTGPTAGETDETLIFTASPQPGDATTPITYTWSSDGLVGGQGTAEATYRWSNTGIKTVQVTARNSGGEDVTDSQDVDIDVPSVGDIYEDDDTCAQASAIATEGTIQSHTFHDQADTDWVTFDAKSDVTYLIEAQIPTGSPADVILELYDQCDTLPEETQDYTFTPGARLEFATPVSGTFYLKLLNHDATVYGPDLAYQLTVRALEAEATPGALVLVAGKIRANDPLQENIYHVTAAVRQLFLAHDYDDERIAYLAPDTSQTGVDYLVSAETLEQAITTWAPDKVGPDRPFTLYMMDHGDYDQFYLDKSRGEWVTPQEVDAWLDTLEAAVPGVTVNVIVEACKSGSFIDLTESVSAPGRVVIASTGAWRIAWATDEGAVFSDHFIAGLDQGKSLFGAFQTARWATEAAHVQTPWLDDDGDGLANGAWDGTEAAQRGFSFAGTLLADEWPPYIVAATGPTEIAQGHGVLQAEVRDDEDVHRVWAVIYPPSYEPPTSGVEMPQENLPTIVLQDQGDDRYSATYTGFDELGSYRVVIHAEDNDRREGRPLAIEVHMGWEVYLPLVLRAP